MGRVTSIKVKLGLLVAASVLVASVLATLGAGAVPAALSIPVTVLLALGVTQLLAVGMTSPLRQMTEAARRMAAGDYDVRVDTSSTDEVGELARTFNRMAADLATVDRQRRDLVASVSHELRTPLTALVAVLENLDDRVTEPDPATIRVALGQAQRLSNLVSDLLDLSRVDAGVVALDRGPVPVAALVGDAVTEARAGMRSVSFDVRIEPPGLVVDADRSRLHQLLANLLDNAARHSPEGGVVRIWAGRVGDVVRLEVTDDGAGIAPEDRERVFVRFGTLQDTGGGTGLGLAIARWVTDLHGGRIGLVDPVPGESGARFRVDLPQTVPARYRPRPPPVVASAAARPRPPDDVRRPTPPIDGCRRSGRSGPNAACPRGATSCSPVSASGSSPGCRSPTSTLGLATTLMLLASGLLVLWVSRHRRSPFTWACARAGRRLRAAVRPAGRRLDPRARAADQRTAHHGGAHTRGRPSRWSLGAISWPFAGLRGHAMAGAHASGRRWRRQQRRGDPDRDPLRARPCSSSGCCSPPATRSSATGSAWCSPTSRRDWCCAASSLSRWPGSCSQRRTSR